MTRTKHAPARRRTNSPTLTPAWLDALKQIAPILVALGGVLAALPTLLAAIGKLIVMITTLLHPPSHAATPAEQEVVTVQATYRSASRTAQVAIRGAARVVTLHRRAGCV